MSPESAFKKPPIKFKVVVLPQPEGPNIVINSPSFISKFTFSIYYLYQIVLLNS